MSENSRQITSLFIFVFFGWMFLLTPINEAEVRLDEVKEVKEEE